MRKEEDANERQALKWNPQGTHRRRRCRGTWQRGVSNEAEHGKKLRCWLSIGSDGRLSRRPSALKIERKDGKRKRRRMQTIRLASDIR